MVEYVNTMGKKEDKNKKILENTKKSNENQQEMNKKKLIKKYHEWFKKLETNLSKVTRKRNKQNIKNSNMECERAVVTYAGTRRISKY